MSQSLHLAHNGKTKFYKSHNNTVGLMFGRPAQGGTCPGSTLGCGGCLEVKDGRKNMTCYMKKLVIAYPALGPTLTGNTDLLVGKTESQMVEVLTATVEAFKKKDKGRAPFFRLHYSGDFFSKTYAQAWTKVIRAYPDIHFWTYTRSIDLVPFLVGIPNFSVYISSDPVNREKAIKMYQKYEKTHKNLGICMMSDTEEIPGIKFVTCPETSGKLKNTPERGACAKCRMCINNYQTRIRNIRFIIH